MKVVLLVRVAAGAARAELSRGSKLLWAAESAFDGPDALREAMAQLTSAEGMPARPARLRIEMGEPYAQVRRLHDLPHVRSGHLKALVANQAGRFFRRNGKPLVTDAVWLGGGRQRGAAIGAAAEEPWIAAVVGGAGAGGAMVECIWPAGAWAGSGLDLLPAEEVARRRRRRRLALGRISLVAVLAWTTAAIVWGVRFDRERRAVDKELDRLRAPAAALASARRALGEAAELVDSIKAAERRRGLAAAEIAELSVLLPDSAYATSLSLDGTGGGELAVVARRSVEVMAALERAAALPAVRTEGTTVRDEARGLAWDRFTIRFGVAR
jgi:Tfp pilus assembly protein PilN